MGGIQLKPMYLTIWLVILTTTSVSLRPYDRPNSSDAKDSVIGEGVLISPVPIFVPQPGQILQQIQHLTPPPQPQGNCQTTKEQLASTEVTSLVGPAVKSVIFNTNVLREPEVNKQEEKCEKLEKLSIDDYCAGIDRSEMNYEFELPNSNSENVGVVGRLQRCKQYWFDTFNLSLFVKDILNHGYIIPFKNFPPRAHLNNNRSSLNHPDFVAEAINKLLVTGSIKEQVLPPYVVNPLTVSESNKLRLVLDLRHVNQFTCVTRFKYEGLDTLAQMFSTGFYFFTFDLESGYHHIDIFEPHQKYLGFSWKFGNKVRFFTFSVLPFGLNTASYCFTKILRPLVTRWRYMGHCSILYIDDGISGHDDKTSALAASHIVQKDLACSGFKVSVSKSDFVPKQSGIWLGMLIDTISMQFRLPDNKLAKTQNAIAMCLDKRMQYVPVRDVARIAGFIISASAAIGRLSRLFTRHLYKTIESRDSWSSMVLLSAGSLAELEFWYKNLHCANGQPIKPLLCATSGVYSDASGTGFGGFSVQFNDSTCSGLWSESESKECSTSRELRAILYVLRSLGPKLSGKKLKWYTDSQNACRIISVGSTKPNLHDLSIMLYNCCLKFKVSIEPEWLPRELNQRADELSRIVDPDDWSLNRNIFLNLNRRFGPHTVDRFASHYNTQLPRFNSRFWNPGCEAADCFTQNWASENNWVCPPVCMVLNAVKLMKECKATGTVIVPEWPSAAFWPTLSPTLGVFKTFLISHVILPNIPNLCTPGRGQCTSYKPGKRLFQGSLPFKLIAMRYDFNCHDLP